METHVELSQEEIEHLILSLQLARKYQPTHMIQTIEDIQAKLAIALMRIENMQDQYSNIHAS